MNIGRETVKVCFDKNGYGYIYNETTKTYEAIVNSANSEKLAISKILIVGNDAIIITQDNKVFESAKLNSKAIKLDDWATKKGDTVIAIQKSEEFINHDMLELVLIFESGRETYYLNLMDGYDVKNKKEIDVNTLEKYTEQ